MLFVYRPWKIFVVFFFCIVNLLQAQVVHRLDGTTIDTGALTAKISEITGAAKVHGLELAVFNNDRIVYKRAFGTKDMSTGMPLRTDANMYGASLSKTVFAVLVMRLVDEGVLNLDKPLQDYLPKPIYDYEPKTKWQDDYRSLKNDTLYRKITARMCLDHTSGFPNWRFLEPDEQLRVKTVPGSRYMYSGEGMVYLQTVIEKMTGRTLQQLSFEKIFRPLKMTHSAYRWLPEYEADYAVGHDQNGKPYPKDKDNEPRAPSTLETSLDDFALFVQAVLQKKLLSAKSWKEMVTPQVCIRAMKQFGPLSLKDSTANDDSQLSYGLGWGLIRTPYGWGAFKEGHGDGFQHYCIIFPEKHLGMVVMTNSDNGETTYDELLKLTIADSFTPLFWENYPPFRD